MENIEKHNQLVSSSGRAYEEQEIVQKEMKEIVEILFDLWSIKNSSKCPSGSFNNEVSSNTINIWKATQLKED